MTGYIGSGNVFYIDGVDLTASDYAAPHINGDLPGCSWDGTEHNSDSSFDTTTTLTVSDVDVLNHRDELTIWARVQTPRKWDQGEAWLYVMDSANSGDGTPATDNRFSIAYGAEAGSWQVYCQGAQRLVSSPNSHRFQAEDWIDVGVTMDFAQDRYKLFIDGMVQSELRGPGGDNPALSTLDVDTWRIGGHYSKTPTGTAMSEFAVFQRVLTDQEMATLHRRTTPLVDGGAAVPSGIYMLDGQFTLASSASGARVELTSSGFTAYESSGEGARFDVDGVTFITGENDINALKWDTDTPARKGELFVADNVDESYGQWTVTGVEDSYIYLKAATTSEYNQIISYCDDDGSANSYIGLQVHSAEVARVMDDRFRVAGFLSITDGVTAPGTASGYAHIYVDTSDGDLKVKFGDGTVKTISTDS